jgi:hypothetical protein
MPRISLTDFVDIVSKSGTPKANKIREVKGRPAYDPTTDYYKQCRDWIISTHAGGHPRTHLHDLFSTLTNPKKDKHFNALMDGYKKWWGKTALDWFIPPSSLYSAHGVEVSVNPELGLMISGKPHLIKLYFKAEGITKNRIETVTHLMEISLRPLTSADTKMSLLDIRKSKLFTPTVPIPGLSAMLDAELAYIAAYWAALP